MDRAADFPGCAHRADAAAVANYLARRLDPAAEEAFERHAFGCQECWDELRLAVEIRAASARPRSPALDGRRGALAAAAVFTVALVGGGLWWRAQVRAVPATPVLRGAAETELRTEVRREADRRELWWDAVAGAASYRVTFFDEAGRTLDEVETRGAPTVIDLTEAVNAGASSARVSALDEFRQTVAASAPVALRRD